MKILLTAGPTREPIDAVRYIGNRSSGRMGLALASAARSAGHILTAIVGPIELPLTAARRIDVETTQQMHDAVLAEFPYHDLLIMAAAVGDFRPAKSGQTKLPRDGKLVLELEPTPDIVAAAAATRRPHQRVVGFSLEVEGEVDRARRKLAEKKLDLLVFNPLKTIQSDSVTATLLWPDGRSEPLAAMNKTEFAKQLMERAAKLWWM
jgi:phosphopantothenoylcysteine decarboxylase/phosphopantothenate--cysteine ligase